MIGYAVLRLGHRHHSSGHRVISCELTAGNDFIHPINMSARENHAADDHQAPADGDSERKWYLLLSNPSKTTHLGTLLRCAAAHRAHQVLLVGYDKFNCQGSFGSHLFLDIVAFPSWDIVHDYLKRGGIEDGDDDNHHSVYANGDVSNCKTDDSSSISNAGAGQSSSTTEASTSALGNHGQIQRNPITVIGILGAYGGGEEIFSTDGVPVYQSDGYVSLVPPQGDGTAKIGQTEQNQDTATLLSERSFPVNTRPFATDVCFLLSKDKRGMPISQARVCSGFVHVPHLNFDVHDDNDCDDGVASNESITPASASETPPNEQSIKQSTFMDTATTLSIVLHHFTAWAGYTERAFEENQKFVKEIKPDARRRLCRVIGQSNKKKRKGERNGLSQDEENAMEEQPSALDSAMLFGDTSKASDY